MSKKFNALLICLGSLVLCSLTSCRGGDAEVDAEMGSEMEAKMEEEIEADVVSKVPEGFVPLIELNEREDTILRIVLWESQISFMDDSGYICIYQAPFVENPYLIVKYEGFYYVNEAKFLEFDEIAALAREERQRTYSIGEEVAVRDWGENVHHVKIISLEAVAAEPIYGDTLITYHIKFAVAADVPEYKIRSIFKSGAETENGMKLSNPDFIDRETVSVKFRKKGDDRISAIVLSSPEYPGLRYWVVVDD